MRISILYQDPDLVVVDKPAGIPTHAPDPGDPYPGDALRIVQAQTGLSYLGMHQRLDADTSGVLLFAARREANKALAAAFEGRNVRKVYLALVHGTPPRDTGMIDAPIVREHGERYRVTMPSDPRGLAARTRYRVVDHRAGVRSQESGVRNQESRPAYSLLELIPETGRPHQIRVHLAHIGCPVVGDPLYGPADRPAPRLFLHAYQLTLPHPATGEPMTFTAPAPEMLRGDGTAPSLAGRGLGIGDARVPHIRDMMQTPDALRGLLRLAVERRAPLAADPQTDIYRLANGAADGLPGLTVDRYGDALVAAIYDDDATLPPRPIRGALTEMLAEATGAASIYVKYRPREAGRIPDDQLRDARAPATLCMVPICVNSSPARKAWLTSSAPAMG